MSLRDDGTSTDDLPALASGVARSTHFVQATLWCRQFLCLWQSPLPGGFPRPIDVKDHAFDASSIDLHISFGSSLNSILFPIHLHSFRKADILSEEYPQLRHREIEESLSSVDCESRLFPGATWKRGM
jgi:hypothetical protein